MTGRGFFVKPTPMLDDESKREINDKVVEVTARAVSELQAAQSKIGFSSPRKTRAQFGKKDELISRIGFKFPKPLIFREQGAGRGQGGRKGSQWKNNKGQTIKTNPKSLGKMNSGTRLEKPLINPVIEKFTDELTQAVASEFVTLSFKNIRIK